MRRLLVFACRAFPPDHRARKSDEVVDTALLAAGSSTWKGVREGLSLVGAGGGERLRAERHMSARDGVELVARLLALLNLAVALYGISFAFDSPVFGIPPGPPGWVPRDPYVADWWWAAFAVSAAGVVVGLALASRALALGAALANLGLVGYDAVSLGDQGHFGAFAPFGIDVGYPLDRDWLAPAVLLVLVVAATPLRRSLARLPLMLVGAASLDVVARQDSGGFIFLGWPFGVALALAILLGWLSPRLAVVAIATSCAFAPFVIAYLMRAPGSYIDPVVGRLVAPALALGIVVPFAYLALRRRFT